MAQKRFSEEERLEIIKKFNNRKIPISKFCKKHNVSRPSLYRWKGLYKSKLQFIPLQIKSTQLSDDTIKLNKNNEVSQIISSPIKFCKSGLIVEFNSGCSKSEVKLIMEILDAPK